MPESRIREPRPGYGGRPVFDYAQPQADTDTTHALRPGLSPFVSRGTYGVFRRYRVSHVSTVTRRHPVLINTLRVHHITGSTCLSATEEALDNFVLVIVVEDVD